MIAEPLPLQGAYLINGFKVDDSRGWFWKNYRSDKFIDLGLDFFVRETYFSWSKKNVLRGMHFQLPPKAHEKLVTCVFGEVIDVLLDLRIKSPHYGKCVSILLSDSKPQSLLIPIGVAHGFLVLSDGALLSYQTSTEYDVKLDNGVRWDSFGFNWPVVDIKCSDRDANLPTLADFNTPF